MMFLNLAAAWKDLASGRLMSVLSEEEADLVLRGFYCGAHATLVAQANIVEEHEGEAATILLKALWQETRNFALEPKRATEAAGASRVPGRAPIQTSEPLCARAPNRASEPKEKRVPKRKSEPTAKRAPKSMSEPGHSRAPGVMSEPMPERAPPPRSEPLSTRASNRASEPSH